MAVVKRKSIQFGRRSSNLHSSKTTLTNPIRSDSQYVSLSTPLVEREHPSAIRPSPVQPSPATINTSIFSLLMLNETVGEEDVEHTLQELLYRYE